MTTTAASLVEQAKRWAGHYGAYPNGEEGAVLSAPLRIRAAWEHNDPDAFADMFIENGSMLVGDEQLTDREAIRAYMRGAFEGAYKGARITDQPLEIRLLTADVALAVTQGGVLLAGEEELSPEREVRAMWVLVRRDGEWKVASHQTSPIRG